MSYGIHDYSVFVLSSCLLNITPGPDTLYILGRTFAQGKRAGIASVLGITTGVFIHTFAAALGLSTLLLTSATAFTVVKLLGATYLLILGVRMLIKKECLSLSVRARGQDLSMWSLYRQGALTNLLNPNVAMFFLALMPQFIERQSRTPALAFVTLGLTFVLTETIWCLLLVQFASVLNRQFARHPASPRILDKCMGSLFVALSLHLAIQGQ
jgi:threonine/homoserine/homoserine lactone efflux protein